MGAYLARRLATLVPVLAVVGAIVFVLVHLTPGDPATLIAGPQATADRIEALRKVLGLDAPLPLQFVRWLGAVLHGDLGTSLYFNEPVGATLAAHAGPTLSLTAIAFALTLAIAIPSGTYAAMHARTPVDRMFLALSLVGVSIPSFWLALVLILIFAVHFGWFPVAGYVPPEHGWWLWLRGLVLPAFVLAAQQAGFVARILRDALLDVLDAPYIQTARAKGVPPTRIIIRHALRNALVPTATVAGTSLAALLGGAVVTETVFSIPGIGQLIVDSVARRDFPVIAGAVLLAAAIYVGVNAIVDVSYTLIDPRIRYE